jgi:hypothetical protein
MIRERFSCSRRWAVGAEGEVHHRPPPAPTLGSYRDGSIEHVDAFNSACRNAPQQFGQGDVLSRGPRAIDQNIAGRVAKAAQVFARNQRETWDPGQHIEGVLRLNICEVCCRIARASR